MISSHAYMLTSIICDTFSVAAPSNAPASGGLGASLTLETPSIHTMGLTGSHRS